MMRNTGQVIVEIDEIDLYDENVTLLFSNEF